MKKFLLAALVAFSTFANVSAVNPNDLVLEGERWIAKFSNNVCDDGNTMATEMPAELSQIGAQFYYLSTDYSLDNVLMKAVFVQGGVQCSYSALLFADNDAWTIKLVESKALPEANCAQGKEIIDHVLEFNTYKYFHGRAAIYHTFSNSQAACAGEDKIGLQFQVQGRR